MYSNNINIFWGYTQYQKLLFNNLFLHSSIICIKCMFLRHVWNNLYMLWFINSIFYIVICIRKNTNLLKNYIFKCILKNCFALSSFTFVVHFLFITRWRFLIYCERTICFYFFVSHKRILHYFCWISEQTKQKYKCIIPSL